MCDEKSIFWWNCLKIEIFGNFSRKSKYFGKLPKKSKFFGNLTWKIEICYEITWKIRNFSEISPENRFFCEIAWKNLNFSEKSKFFYPGPRPPRFQTRLTPLPPFFLSGSLSPSFCHLKSCLFSWGLNALKSASEKLMLREACYKRWTNTIQRVTI